MKRIEIVEGDITRQKVDAIVNAANSSLLGGGGVDGAIHRAAGPELLEECRTLGGCPTGQARITKGYNLPAKWVIHTVGPVWYGGNRKEDEYLASCYRSCFELVEKHNSKIKIQKSKVKNQQSAIINHKSIKTIAFPAISTGVYRFPLERATKIAVAEAKKFLEKNKSIEKVIFVCFGKQAYDCYRRELG